MAEQDQNLLTVGSVPRQMLTFALPIFLSNLFQQLYNAVDSLIVGRYIGEQALAASHTLKGMTGNLSMTVLFDLFSRQVEAIRGGDWERAVSLMDEITPARERVLSLIETL